MCFGMKWRKKKNTAKNDRTFRKNTEQLLGIFLYEIREELVQAQYFTTVDAGDIYHGV